MADNKVVVEFEIDDKNSSKAIDNLGKKTADVGKKAKDSGEKASKSFKDMATNIGKSLGIIGLVAGAINIVKDALAGNQKIVDFFAVSMGVLSDMVRDAFNFVIDNAGAVVDYFKAIFEDPIGSLQEMGNAIKENIIERFESWLEMFGHVGKAIKHLFAGEWTEAWNAAKEAGSEAVDVITGVDNTVGKVTEAVGKAADAIGSYVKKTIDANVELVNLQNNAKLAAAEQARLSEQYDRQAELLRQARDDERKSIEDRIKANNELADVLDKQEKAELSAANAQVAAAQAMIQHNNTIDNQVALTQALANADGVRAKIAGLRSEQQMNDLALSKEKNDLLKTESEATNQLSIESKRFYAERIKSDFLRLNALKYVLGEERKLELARLQEQINAHAEGTQARLEAQIAYNQKQQEFAQQEITLDDQIKEAKKKNAKEAEDAERQSQEKRIQMASDAIGALMSLADALGKNDKEGAKRRFRINKALGIAQAGINTYMAVNAALTAGGNPIKLATGAQFVEAGIALTMGLANVAKIAKTKFDDGGGSTSPSGGGGGGGGMGASSGGGSTAAPSLDLSFLNNAQTKAQPIQSYVLATNVTSAQDAQQKILDQSKLIK
jgi:hypothetical protein